MVLKCIKSTGTLIAKYVILQSFLINILNIDLFTFALDGVDDCINKYEFL